MAAGSAVVLGPGDRGLGHAVATVTAAANEAFLRTALGPNSQNRETENGNERNGSVVSVRRKTSDVSALEVPVVAAPDQDPGLGLGLGPGPGSVTTTTTTTGPSNEIRLENMEASKMITTTSNRGTMRKDRDKRPLSPGKK